MKKIGIHPFGHDSAICIIDHEKQEIFAVSLERVTRFKHDYRFVHPLLEQFCSTMTSNTKLIVSMLEVDVEFIEYFETKFQIDKLLKKHHNIFNSNRSKLSKVLAILRKSPKDVFGFYQLNSKMKSFSFQTGMEGFSKFMATKYGVKESNVIYTDHHFAHACSTYYSAPIHFKDNCLVMTLDGQGDGAFCKIFKIKDNKPVELLKSSNEYSIPLLYAIFTGVAGFVPNADEGKLEALACYGQLSKDNILYQILDNAFYYEDDFIIRIKQNNADFPFHSIPEQYEDIAKFLQTWKEKIGEKDFSAAIQLFFEEFFLRYMKDLQQKYGAKNIALAGGGFANVKLNLRVVEDKVFDEVFIFHAMGDDGCPFGALIYDDVCDGIDTDWIRNSSMPYYGTSYSKEEVEKVLSNNNQKIYYEYLGETSYIHLAQDIASDKICALFQNKMEYGPRALGHRSILANPRNPQIREDINMKFKKREWFQPFCPSILEEEREKLFTISYPNKFMTCAFTIKKDFAGELPSIVHVDNTARPQFVEKEDDEYYFNLLKELQKINGYGVVLDTSFNIHGKTIVMTPEDALNDFFACGIDALYIENFKVTKK